MELIDARLAEVQTNHSGTFVPCPGNMAHTITASFKSRY